MAGFAFDLVCPEARLAQGEATSVLIPGADGDMTAGPGHEATVTSLRPGIVEAHLTDGTARFLVTRGFAEISAESISVIAENAYRDGEATREQLESVKSDAEAELAKAIEDEEKTAIGIFLNEISALIEDAK